MQINIEEEPLKIVLADDHEVVRAGLRRLLSVDKKIKILDEASNGRDAADLVNYHHPDIALLDIMMPLVNGIEATQIIKKESPDVFVVILTAYEDSYHLEQALSAGADGYLTKDISAKELVESLHNVFKGERVFSKSIIKLMQKKYLPESEHDPSPISISKREQEVLNLVALGKTSAEIADQLFVSVRTVETHRYNIMQKLGIKNTAGLVRYAVYNYDRLNVLKKENNTGKA